MSSGHFLVIACGVLALIYGVYAGTAVMSAGTGTVRMREIAAAVQEGARADARRRLPRLR